MANKLPAGDPSQNPRRFLSFHVSLLLLIILGFSLAFYIVLTNFWSWNKAANDYRPIDRKMKSIGAYKICSDSDLGFDSGEAYISSNYLIDANGSEEAVIKSAAQSAGYVLQKDTNAINLLKSTPRKYDEANDYLIGHKGQYTLAARIIRKGTGSLDVLCNASKVQWGANSSPPAGKTLIQISDSTPSSI